MKFILIGHPVGHSLSPAIHHAAYGELGLADHRYVAVDCPTPDDVRRALDALRRGEIAGANVTVPWKRLALDLADEVDASARDTGAANVLRPLPGGAGRLVAHNTDVPALAAELARGRADARAAAVIGSGGAALAAVVACRLLGMRRVVVVARKFRGDPAGWDGAAELRARGGTPMEWPEGPAAARAFAEALAGTDVVVQSTTDGMRGATDGTTVAGIVPWSELPRSTFAYDVVYNPAVTPFVTRARAHGLHAESGLGMLVGQAALAIELWLGRRPPEEPLRAAAERALAARFGAGGPAQPA